MNKKRTGRSLDGRNWSEYPQKQRNMRCELAAAEVGHHRAGRKADASRATRIRALLFDSEPPAGPA